MKIPKTLMVVAAAFMAAATLQAQTYSDSVRTKTWSLYVQGGMSGYHGARGSSFDCSRMPLSPDVALGVKYNVKPWVRFGLNAGYTMVKSINRLTSTETSVIPGFKVGDHTTNLEVTKVLLQNRNDIHLAGADLNVDFNILGMWPNRKAQKWNMYLGVGVGYMYGWTRNAQSVAVDEEAVAKGDTYFNVYNHSYLESTHTKGNVNAIYIPASLSLEYDLSPWWTIGVIGQYKYMPMDKEFTPQGIYSAGLVLRYNFANIKTNKRLYYETLGTLHDVEADRDQLRANLIAVEADKAETERLLDEQKRINDDLARDLADCRVKKTGDHVVYFLISDSKLSKQEQLRLDEYVETLKNTGGYSLTIIGEASADGNSKANQKLSERRLQRVVKYLNSKGIANPYIRVEKAIGDSEQGLDPKYRRVRIINGAEK